MRGFPVVLALLLAPLAACGTGGPELGLRAGPAGLLSAPAALDAAGAAFVGPGTGSGGGLTGLDGGLLDSRGPVVPHVTRSRQIGVSAGLRQPLGDGPGGGRLSLAADLRIEAGTAAWHLPGGLGILVDPMDIRIATRTLAPELRLHWDRPVAGNTRLDLSASAGVMLVQSRTRVRSALIALDHRSHQRLPYLTAGAGLRRDQPGGGSAGLGLHLTAARPGGVQARLVADLRR